MNLARQAIYPRVAYEDLGMNRQALGTQEALLVVSSV
jgi:hypothetical protein